MKNKLRGVEREVIVHALIEERDRVKRGGGNQYGPISLGRLEELIRSLANPQTKIGLLILSYNINEPNWRQTVWGTPPDKPGRLVKAAAVMMEEDADMVVITGGAGQKEGKSEAQWMKDRLYRGLEELKEFTVYPVLQKFSPEEIREKLDRALKLEETAKNTTENMSKTGAMFRNTGVERVIIVTSPDHISRALRDAIQFWSKDFPELAMNVYGTPSVTFYSARPGDEDIARIENVVIAEPPTMRKFNLSRLFGVLGNSEALAEIDVVLKKYGK